MITRNFVYVNAKKVVSAYSLLEVSESEEHIQGVCLKSNSLKTFRKDRILEDCESLDDALVKLEALREGNFDDYIFSKSKPKKDAFEVCFTGFKKADKDRLIAKAVDNKMDVRSSVTQNLYALCCGYNAGPTKVTAARMKGVMILDEEQFINLIETGEVPDT
ncbi:Uncharacterised protein [Yersinia ruckeri]|uniref:hypothetical protein n=1 Tax=Yersinia ruckeri TaxID=29486 RepID=UPI0005E6D1E7|nr:hypothetical protein [Yersinia ruckeri]UIM99387.1 hypothetical protein LGL91_09260 [Yersinia ruckeri]UIN08806.1 hypothetical protein LGL88_07680 [Yersinia ruckeri]CNB35931.1 Uncharacterised protein [Yersinia ruckeri]